VHGFLAIRSWRTVNVNARNRMRWIFTIVFGARPSVRSDA